MNQVATFYSLFSSFFHKAGMVSNGVEIMQVPSICILASLDRFFEFMDLPTYDVNLKETESGKVQKHAPEDSPLEAKINSGLDRIVGVVDTSYIQHCCPALMVIMIILLSLLKVFLLCFS